MATKRRRPAGGTANNAGIHCLTNRDVLGRICSFQYGLAEDLLPFLEFRDLTSRAIARHIADGLVRMESIALLEKLSSTLLSWRRRPRLISAWDDMFASLPYMPVLVCVHAAYTGDVELVAMLHSRFPQLLLSVWIKMLQLIHLAAARNHLLVLQFLHVHECRGWTPRVMDVAAANGHLAVVKFLHIHRDEGCTTDALDDAAAHGHLSVVEFLHFHRTEGCTKRAVEGAVGGNHVAVVRFLMSHRADCRDARLVHLLALKYPRHAHLLDEIHETSGARATS
ncbi:hypothetical protein LEN26_005513 [Aphanomyces euteiches]|nr:hypothetical protein AeMF1_009113 [Aphanomyces euteiches]KAH9137929.1 hypothetical protein LEN26_005513 [Aphanomyces euteiches]KAH9197960.1 hypothetical protein AeNC1_000051 [Aphanomyces euteiches]